MTMWDKNGRMRLSELALAMGLVFLLSAVGCGQKEETKNFKVSAPVVRAADGFAATYRDFTASPSPLTLGHYLDFGDSEADRLSVKAACSQQTADGGLRPLETASWVRDFRSRIYFLEITPLDVALSGNPQEPSILCSFEFVALRGDSTHSFRLMNVTLDPTRFEEGLRWDMTLGTSQRDMRLTSFETRDERGNLKLRIDLVCDSGSDVLEIDEDAKVNLQTVEFAVKKEQMEGRLSFLEPVQTCSLARIEDGVVRARSRSFVLNLAPTIRIFLTPNSASTFVVQRPREQVITFDFRGEMGILTVRNETEAPARVRIPRRIGQAAQVSGFVELRRRGGEAKSACRYNADLRLSPLQGQVLVQGDHLEISLGAYESVLLRADFSHQVYGISSTGKWTDDTWRGRAPEIYVSLNPLATVGEVLSPEGELMVHAPLEVSSPFRLAAAGSHGTGHVIGAGTAIISHRRACVVREHAR